MGGLAGWRNVDKSDGKVGNTRNILGRAQVFR